MDAGSDIDTDSEFEIQLEISDSDIGEIPEADIEPVLEAEPDLAEWSDLVSEVASFPDAQPTAVSPDSEANETEQVQAASGVREFMLATH